MSYCSDVAIAVKKEDFIAFKTQIENNPALNCLTSLFNEDQNIIDCERDGVLWTIIRWQYVKWYSEYEDVKAVESWLKSLESYEFVRAGEYPGDIDEEKKGDFDNFFYACTTNSIEMA